MNIINKTFLKLALLPAGLYNKMGVDLPQLTAILETKLTMDDRRPSAMYQVQRKKDKPIKAATVMTMLFSAIMGLFFLLAFSFDNNMVTSLTLYFTFIFVMLSATLISDFTSVLIDIRDSFIILPKPVSDRTFVTARLLHIFIHICKILVPMSLPGFIYMVTDSNILGGLLFWLLVGFVSLFAIFFINAVYILILKITTPQKFQSIISYIQIVFAIVVYGAYQVIPRVMGQLGLEEFNVEKLNGILFFPLYWFASAWNSLYHMQGSTTQWIAGGGAFLLPFASLYIVIKYLAPSFNNKLAMINNSGPEKKPDAKNIPIRSKKGYAAFIAGLLTRNAAEKNAFLLSWKLSGRSRDFKLKVYPGIGYLVVYIIIIFWNSAEKGFESIEADSLAGRGILLSFLYLTTMILTLALGQMSFSDKYKASWIYYTLPVEKPGEIILGAAKALIMKFYFPIVVILTLSGFYFLGLKAIPHLILGTVNVILITFLIVLAGNKFFPFSRAQNNNSNTGNFIRSLFMLLVGGMIGMIHFFVFTILPVVIIFMLLSITALWLLMENIRNTSWATIKSKYADD